MKSYTKDYVLIGIFSALNYVAIIIGGMLSNIFGPIGHLLLGGSLGGLLSGSLFLVLSKKIQSKWIFTKVYLVTLLLFQLMGQGYLPWIMSILISSIIADLICIKSNYKNRFLLAISHGITIFGIAGGSLFPILLFAEKYRDDWVARGVPLDYMQKSIEFLKGPMWIIAGSFAILGGIIGVYLGSAFFEKHFSKLHMKKNN